MTSGQSSFPVARSLFQVQPARASPAHGSANCCRITARSSDDIAIIKTTNTEAINHDPAITFIQTGSQQPGRPSMGAWVSYGLGSENQNLPAFVVLICAIERDQHRSAAVLAAVGQRLSSLQLPGREVPRGGDPVLYLSDPPGIDKATRRRMLDGIAQAEPDERRSLRRSRNRNAHLAV